MDLPYNVHVVDEKSCHCLARHDPNLFPNLFRVPLQDREAAMLDDTAANDMYTPEEWSLLMQEVAQSSRHWSLNSDEDAPMVSSDFDCLPSDA